MISKGEKRPATDTEPGMQTGDPLGVGTGEKHSVAWSAVRKHKTKNCCEVRTSHTARRS